MPKKNNKQSVALSSVFASALLTVLKLIVGLLTGSIGIISEAAHSGLDLGAALLTYFAIRVGDMPADKDHPYGHGKVESISALIETGLLFLTSIWIVYEAVHRLLAKSVEINVTWYAFAVIIFSIIIDYSRSRALYKTAKETSSQALEADALHFRSDIYSSAVVLGGLVLVSLGIKGADAIAAIGVALFVVVIGIKLGRRTIDVLVDTAPEGTIDKISDITKNVTGVLSIEKIRVRPVGPSIFIDMIIGVNRKIPLEQVREVIKKVEKKIIEEYPEADMTIGTQPIILKSETIDERIHLIAQKHNGLVHDIIVHITKGSQKIIDFDLEVSNNLSVEKAHKVASHIEKEIKKEFGKDTVINTHIEPVSRRAIKFNDVTEEENTMINGIFSRIKDSVSLVKDMHDVQIKKVDDKYFVSVHCVFDSSVPLEEAHLVSSKVEYLAKSELPALQRVVVHVEPPEN